MQTKLQLLSDNARLSLERDAYMLALNDVLNHKVKWFGRGKLRVGVSRPCGAAGGIVIEKNDDYYVPSYFESWYDYAGRYSGSDESRLALRELAFQVETFIRSEQSKHGMGTINMHGSLAEKEAA